MIKYSLMLNSNLDPNAIIVILRVSPRAQTPRFQPSKDGTDQLAKRGGVDWLLRVLLRVEEIVIVHACPGKADPVGLFKIVEQPFDGGGRGAEYDKLFME